MANNSKNKTNNKTGKEKNTKKEVTKKNNTKKEVSKKNDTKKDINKKSSIKNEEIKVTEIKETKKVEEKVKKEKKSFTLTSKQKDIILVLLVLVLLVVGLILTSPKKEHIDIELPVALSGDAGFTEITYNEYKEKVANNEMFLVVIVRDGCGYCEMFEPVVEEVAGEYKLPIYYINLTNISDEEQEELSSTNKYLKRNKWGTPTTLFMYGENVVDSISGYVEKDAFVSFIKENFKVEE